MTEFHIIETVFIDLLKIFSDLKSMIVKNHRKIALEFRFSINSEDSFDFNEKTAVKRSFGKEMEATGVPPKKLKTDQIFNIEALRNDQLFQNPSKPFIIESPSSLNNIEDIEMLEN